MHQFVCQWCQGAAGNALAGYWERNRSFDMLLREMSKRFANPVVVETGTIRGEEDWRGAGFFTYLAGAYIFRQGGVLYWTNVFDKSVRIINEDSVSFLQSFQQPIDVLYLDSLDTTEPGHAEHALRELEAALPRLHRSSLVAMDDTPWQAGAWLGKGALAAPLLLKNGWKVLYAGYQVIFTQM
jgi:hypothetical protein